MWLKLEDITPETLDQVAAEWQEKRLNDLARDSMIKLGRDLRRKRQEQTNVEMKAKIRAMRLYNQHDFTKKEIADLLGVETREVSKWLK